MKAHAVLKLMRKAHLYLGIFTTPALLFFAFTGAMQTINLHEAGRGSDYKPPKWIATLAQLHKKQTTEVPVRKGRPEGAGGVAGQQVGESASQRGNPVGQGTERGGGHGGEHVVNAERPMAGAALGTLAAPQKSHWPMKIFFLLVSVSLALSTLTGVYMTYKYDRGWWLLTGLLLAGLVLPVCLLPF